MSLFARNIMALVALGSVVSLSASHPAAAETHRDEARRLFQEGRRLYDKKDYPAALSRFQEASRLYPSYKIDLSTAFALDKLGRSAEAAHVFELYLIDRPDGAERNRPAREMASRSLARIRRELGTVTVDVKVSEAVVEVDGDARHAIAPARALRALRGGGAIPLRHRLYLQPGRHRLSVIRAERVLGSRVVDLRAGEHLWLHLDLDPQPQRADRVGLESGGRAPRSKPFYKKWWFWTVVGAVVAGTAAGIAAGVSARGDTWLPSGDSGTIDLRQ